MKNKTIKIHLSPLPPKSTAAKKTDYLGNDATAGRKELPPPNWSPTGNSGYWVWRDEFWKWLSDEEYETMKEKELEN